VAAVGVLVVAVAVRGGVSELAGWKCSRGVCRERTVGWFAGFGRLGLERHEYCYH